MFCSFMPPAVFVLGRSIAGYTFGGMDEPNKDQLAELTREMADRLSDDPERVILPLVGAKGKKRPTLFGGKDLPDQAMDNPVAAAKFIRRVAEVSQLSDVRQPFKELASVAEVVEEERCFAADAVFGNDYHEDWVPLGEVAVLRGHAETVLDKLVEVYKKTGGDFAVVDEFGRIADRINRDQEIPDDEAETFERIYSSVLAVAAETEKLFSDVVNLGREALAAIEKLRNDAQDLAGVA